MKGDQFVARRLPYIQGKHKQIKGRQTSMPRVTIEPTTPAFERAKAVHGLACAATVSHIYHTQLSCQALKDYCSCNNGFNNLPSTVK
jgi:hypothetical protein